MTNFSYPTRSSSEIRQALRQQQEVALIDVREEEAFAAGHPLFAANIALSKLELEILNRIPRLTTPVTVYDNGEGLAEVAAQRLSALGYQDVALLEAGLAGWRDSGGELFIDVNSPSKAFGELVENRSHTPSLSAEEVNDLLQQNDDVVVLDSRRFDEYHTMSIPGGISVPGAELVLRARDLAPSPLTTVIVNCAGRTRSIIGTQSLVNAGIRNPVYALRNGTIGWTLAGLALEHGQSRRYGDASETARLQAAKSARTVADRAGVARASKAQLAEWQQQDTRTLYLFDVRDAEEYAAGHLAASRSVPGGQLVQETDHYASVRGARVVLVDTEGVRANISASWLAQMGWEVYVLDGMNAADFSTTGNWSPAVPALPALAEIDTATLTNWLQKGDTQLLDFTTSANYANGHIPGAAWLQRSLLTEQGAAALPQAQRYVVTCGSSLLARYAVAELESLTGKPVSVLNGGNAAWRAAELPLESGETQLLQARTDRYRRPYEGTDNSAAAMQAYLDWEYGLIAQLDRDGTHNFSVLTQPKKASAEQVS
ncbi:rhodanese homology domain-containing protein [Erwiniaceae bacterium BAC15a-03b]|uniref:Rhodanese homology domain-containing protein n=1 Tax=Winslowiella arboricola TaxID=2978220 RepID=A0A9J6PNG7_9GAMM|nr:rhodanese homology domain-containing protein [Winslowiella arboricola]MCU5771364.1 rhodanese homology domain-containing protein [Winslowiella arboricola]MCU5777184.1 rhodanese homology domain-containing protein [Winslowiella arboricola]